jgi:hypothetical protein
MGDSYLPNIVMFVILEKRKKRVPHFSMKHSFCLINQKDGGVIAQMEIHSPFPALS